MSSFARLFVFAALLGSTQYLAGCGSSSSSGGADAGGGGFKPSESYAYDFTYNGCPTGKQSFSSRADYCSGLEDRSRNHGCALKIRKQTYANECGNDFEETNIAPKNWSGYDRVLKRECNVESRVTTYARLSQYCDYLKDEAANQFCFWSARKDEFTWSGCKGSFSPPPPIDTTDVNPAPGPGPGPNPGPNPGPVATPVPRPVDLRTKLVKEFAAEGIELTVNSYGDRALPGEEPFPSKVMKFWPKLERVKTELFSRKRTIKSLTISSYTTADLSNQRLVLDPGLTENEILGYLREVDRRNKVEIETGIKLSLGIDIFGHETDKLARIQSTNDLLEAKQPQLMELKSLISEIETDTYSAYWFHSHKLRLVRDKLESELERYIKMLMPGAKGFKGAEAAGVEISGDLEVEKDPQTFATIAGVLEREINAVKTLSSLGLLKKIKIDQYSQSTWFSQSEGSLKLATRGPQVQILVPVLRYLAIQYRRGKDLGVPIKTMSYDLDGKYIEAMKRFEARYTVIRSKGKSIKSITLTTKSDYFSSSLYIGSDDKIEDLDRVLAGIK